MSVLATGEFWSATAERAVKTFAQALIGVLTVQGISSAADIDWSDALWVALLATVLSVLSSVASAGVGNAGPSLSSETINPALPPVDPTLPPYPPAQV